MPELAWDSFDVEAEYHESLVRRPKMLTLVAETVTGTPAIEQSTTLAAHPLVSEISLSTAAIAQSATVGADPLVSASAMAGNALVQQAATIAGLDDLAAQTQTDQAGVRWMLDDVRVVSVNDDNTITFAWGPPNKGQFG